jgi:glycosyltransferase involved in cell wall biosynthesis
VHGQAVTTAFLRDRLVERGGALTVVDDGPGGARGIVAARRRLGAVLRPLGTLVAAAFGRRGGGVAYLSVNANRGMVLTALLAGAARLAGRTIVLHHHTASHLARPRRVMRLLARAAGPSAVHVCVCATMAARLRALYAPAVQRTDVLSNIVTLDAAAPPASRTPPPVVRLGHLSNLSFEKGLTETVATLAALEARGVAARLVLAGPPVDAEVAAFLARVRAEFGARIEHRGPVYGAEKARFFADLDVFLFPTRYPNETQGIVNLEALAHGVPVVAYARCCISEDIDADAGLAVPLDAEFAAHAAAWIAAACGEPAARLERGARARARFETLHRAAAAELDRLLARLDGTAPPG